jgi:Icc-related predicted phosphoesterase
MNFSKALMSVAVLAIAVTFVSIVTSPAATPTPPLDLQQQLAAPFRFAAFGDSRFTESTNPDVSNAAIRRAIVNAVAKEKPAFITITGDIVYRGDHAGDWKVWDSETSAWRDAKIPVYPTLGNHDLHGNEQTALANYFQRFPDLQQHRYYSVRFANCLMLALDSSMSETAGPQGEWVKQTLDKIPSDVAFVVVVLHHPPYTSSSDREKYGGGHSARSHEEELGKDLEERQAHTRARFVVFAGHVHNYERHEHGSVIYFVTGGGGAHAYPIERSPSDPFQSATVNYHYLVADVSAESMTVTMHRVEIVDSKEVWTEPDTVTISVPSRKAANERPLSTVGSVQ